MTVKELVAALKKLPASAEVYFPNMEIDQLEPVHRVDTAKEWSDKLKVVLR